MAYTLQINYKEEIIRRLFSTISNIPNILFDFLSENPYNSRLNNNSNFQFEQYTNPSFIISQSHYLS